MREEDERQRQVNRGGIGQRTICLASRYQVIYIAKKNAGFEWRQVAAIVTAQSLNQANDPPFEPGYALVGRGDRDSGSNGKWPREKLV